ncbi:MAG: AraC family ligand binding domain-containing protein, partial [Lachnoclostridium sp.]|nr:AraC family ligand binding domain-containing protein [Lachnoclostridium sp.]
MIDHDFHFGFPFIEENDTAAIRLTRVGVERDWDHSIVHENSDKPIYTYIFQYTLEGSGIVEADGKKYVVNENDAFLLFMASDSRYYTNPESKIHWRYLYIMFIVDANIKRYCN